MYSVLYFYPRSPRGERLLTFLAAVSSIIFLSTLPARGATAKQFGFEEVAKFLSTLPARGATIPTLVANIPEILFLSTLPARGATTSTFSPTPATSNFYPRSPRGERLIVNGSNVQDVDISIHAPREGSDVAPSRTIWAFLRISIHAPREGSDRQQRRPRYLQSAISIHAPREGSDARWAHEHAVFLISIHAPREGSDQSLLLLDLGQVVISIHAPREGSDRFAVAAWYMFPRFLSTLPARGATRAWTPGTTQTTIFLSTLPARGATRDPDLAFVHFAISIHAPREGSDGLGTLGKPHGPISIHAPREGSDVLEFHQSVCIRNFYPRSPRGERRNQFFNRVPVLQFLSTLPARGATSWRRTAAARTPRGFLSTLPARGATPLTDEAVDFVIFLSTLPARGATVQKITRQVQRKISIHAPREGSDLL